MVILKRPITSRPKPKIVRRMMKLFLTVLIFAAYAAAVVDARTLGRSSDRDLIASRRPARNRRSEKRAMERLSCEPSPELDASACTGEALDEGKGMSSACLMSTMTASVGTCFF